MTSNFQFHPTTQEVVPFSAQYNFPSQATRQSKRTVKITPKNNASQYASSATIRFEFPSSGYLNPNTTYFAFNVKANVTGGSFTHGTGGTLIDYGGFEFQNNIQSIFKRVVVKYGSLVLEDIQDFHVLQRMLTEITTPSGSHNSPHSMYQGLGPAKRMTYQGTGEPTTVAPLPYEVTQNRFNYHSEITTAGAAPTAATVGQIVRRYAIPINTGLFRQRNLIPLKFMASQLQVEFELADAVECQTWVLTRNPTASPVPTIPSAATTIVGQPEIVAELLEFDSEFDAAVYDILGTGLPIYYQSWHMTTQTVQPNLFSQINIQESARSVRYALAALLDDSFRTLDKDAHVFVSGLKATQGAQTPIENTLVGVSNETAMDSYQWRLGGVYYPSQPVPCYGGTAPSTVVDSNYADPPVEAYCEVMKVFGNLFGDDGTFFGDHRSTLFGGRRNNTSASGDMLVKSFIIAGNFMSDRGDVISGINAEEQNDLQLLLKFQGTSGGSSKTLKVAVCFDNLIILGENNNLVLIN